MKQSEKRRDVRVQVPRDRTFQYIYRQQRDEPFDVHARDDVAFVFIGNALSGLRNLPLLVADAGWVKAIVALVKLSTRRRSFYCLTMLGRLVSSGWCTSGWCRHYRIEPHAVVIGTLLTRSEARGRGVATLGLKRVINVLVGKGVRAFYIDAAEDNTSSRRVIEKCEFGEPIGLYLL